MGADFFFLTFTRFWETGITVAANRGLISLRFAIRLNKKTGNAHISKMRSHEERGVYELNSRDKLGKTHNSETHSSCIFIIMGPRRDLFPDPGQRGHDLLNSVA